MLFSIITPSFNQLDWLRLCVASVRDQVDDGSKGCSSVQIEHIIQDAGTQGIEQFARDAEATLYRDGQLVFSPAPPLSGRYRLSIFSEPDQGMYDAVNRGLKRGIGNLCAYLNCDEQYLPNTIFRVCEEFARNPGCEVIFGDAILVDPAGTALSYRKMILPEKKHIRLCHLNTLTCSTFFRRSVLERGIYFGDSWKVIGDAVWVHHCLEANCAMRILSVPLSTFCFTGQNLSEQDRLNSESEQARWSKAKGAPASWLMPMASVRHRIRKALSGAYSRRDVEYAIHTTTDQKVRTEFVVKNLGSGWPGQTADIV